MKLRNASEDGIWGLGDIVQGIKDVWTFIVYWFQESFKEVAKWGLSLWGLVTIVAMLVWTILSNIVPLITLLLSTLNGLITGDWNFTPPGSIMSVLAIGNTFSPLQEALGYGASYGLLKGTLALYRFIKSLIPTAGES